MTTLAQSLRTIRKPWQWMAIGAGVLLLCGLFAFPRYNLDLRDARLTATDDHATPSSRSVAAPVAAPVAGLTESVALKSIASVPQNSAGAVDRKIIRTTSISMIVQNPAEMAQKIAALADASGGYLVSSESGGVSSATLTIRVPANRFDEARAEIRKLGLRVESEKVDAQDVTTQYVDQDASLRNLRAEEAGYLEILKQAHTVKDMLAVTEQLSNVRGQIEEQQAEFNALSKQVETVAISVSLRTESEAQVFGLNWRPLYQVKMALRDGLDAIGNYAAAMISILFYLPSVILWLGTIFIVGIGSWRVLRWAGRRWFGWKETPVSAQG